MVTCPALYTGFRVVSTPESLEPILPITDTFSMVVFSSATATGRLLTCMLIVAVLHTSGFTLVLHTVYVMLAVPVKEGFGVNV